MLTWDGPLWAALFSAYFVLRRGAITWGWSPHRDLARINTFVLFGAAAAFLLAVRYARRHDVARFRLCVALSTLLALVFLGVKAAEYSDDLAMALYPRTSDRIALYYLTTGIHALHVVGGVIANVWLFARAPSGPSAPAFVDRVETAAMYWMFLAVIWICLFVLLYLW